MDRPIDVSPYFKTRLPLRLRDASLELAIGHSLFSSNAIDAGTRRLLRSLEDVEPPTSIIDLGCGYGPLGLALKAQFPDCDLDMVDRDALAVRFAKANSVDNGIRASVYGSVGYGAIDRRFDLLVSNVPGKAGAPVIERLIAGTQHVLQPSGLAAVVIVSPLADLVAATLKSSNAWEQRRIDDKGHSVFHFGFADVGADSPDPDSDRIYVRNNRTFSSGSSSWTATTLWGLPEFDSLNYSTTLALSELDRMSSTDRMLVFDPGQGHLPVAAALRLKPSHISLVSRDLLALRASERNLESNGYAGSIDSVHSDELLDLGSGFDAVAGFLPEKVPQTVLDSLLDQISQMLHDEGNLLVAGTSTAVTRLVNRLNTASGSLIHRSRKHGHSAALLRIPA